MQNYQSLRSGSWTFFGVKRSAVRFQYAGRRMFLIAVAILLLASPAFAEQRQNQRQEIDLNGQWEYQKATAIESPPESGQWQPISVPGSLTGWNYNRAWFRRSFELPASIKGERIKIRFDGVKYNSRVFVNGKHVGGCFNGYDAFEVDATDAVRFDGPNRLTVGCRDWTGVFSEGKFDFSKKPDWQRPRRFVSDKVIAPIGGHYDQYGIWGDVTLASHPAVFVKDLFIQPSVRNKELVVEYTIANELPDSVEVVLTGVVEDSKRDVLQFPKTRIKIPAGKSVTTTVRQPWADARYWSHEDPFLYHLRTELSTGDSLRTRFGFREFWIEGHRYVLNGSKINLFGTSCWPPREAMGRDEIRSRWKALKAAGITCFRTHTQPWRRVHYEVADEIGLLMISEGAMWHDPYCTAYHDPTYWDNYADMIRAMMKREQNRPSIIMWSMENEAYSGKQKTELAVENLARVGKLAKQWDPTRPIYFESDGDPGGVADAIGMHYVHEYPTYTCWPNEANWLTKPFLPRTWHGMAGDSYRWKKDKPLYIGEFLWVPSGTPAAHTVFFGDDAYQDLDAYTLLGKAEAWKMQILAFRHHEAGGMCPWTVGSDDLTENNPLYRAHQYAYQPIAAFCHDYDGRFYAGDSVKRRVEVFNDILSPSELTLQWTASLGQNIVDKGSEIVKLAGGEKRMVPVTIRCPQVKERAEIKWNLTLQREGKVVFEDTHDYSVFPKLKTPSLTSRIGLYDTDGATARLLAELGVSIEPIQSLETFSSELEVLIIGDATLKPESNSARTIGRMDPQRGAVMEFVKQGGRVLVLRQDAYTEGLFDFSLTSQKSTMTFPLPANHPALDGLVADDLKFWRGDHMVADHEPPRPTSGSAVSIIVSGSSTGLSYAPLLERPMGKGSMIHSQLKLVEKATTEPAAGTILLNLLAYLDAREPRSPRTALIGGDATYREKLGVLGLRFDDIADGSTADLSNYSAVLLCGEVAEMDGIAGKLDSFIKQGGNLYVHRPSTSVLESLSNQLDISLNSRSASGSALRADGDHPLLDAISREDLYWSVRQPGVAWVRQPLSMEMMDGIFAPSVDLTGAAKHEIESWDFSGGYVVAQAEKVMFATDGSATKSIEFSESGNYGIGIRAQGTTCEEKYPVVQITIDDKYFGTVQLDDREWKDYGVSGYVVKGKHSVKISFVNDASNPPNEDRNLFVDRVLIVRDRTPRTVVPLTTPEAVVAVDRGKGRIVLDNIRWDTEFENSRKAERYACSLLTALGADFTPRSAVTIECEQMTPKPGMQWFQSTGGVVYMGSNGYIKADLEVAGSRDYVMELTAAGDESDDVGPLVEVHIDGKKAGQIQLTTEGWRSYPLTLRLEEGQHELILKFVNDAASPSGDRNLKLDKISFYEKQN